MSSLVSYSAVCKRIIMYSGVGEGGGGGGGGGGRGGNCPPTFESGGALPPHFLDMCAP